ncbi:MAG: hypothetical protein ACRDL6_07500 [Solirubrobacterales bacterium]
MPRPELSRWTLACAAFCAIVVAIGAADLARTRDRVPPVPPVDCGTDVACNEARSAELAERDREVERLEQQFGARSWLYASAIIAVITLATAFSLRSRPRQRWPRVFTNLGIIGVWSGLLVVLLLLVDDETSVPIRAAPALAPAVVMLVAAGLGTIVGRVEDWDQPPGLVNDVKDGATAVGKRAIDIGTGGAVARAQYEKLARWLTLGSLALTGITAALAVAFIEAQPGCEGGEIAADWTETVASVSAISAVAAIAAGIGALLLRRWIPALIVLVANPLVGVLMLASTCAFY